MKPFATLDFEASCLPVFGRTYPIEVAICDVDQSRTWSWLIRPHESWADWDWDPESERVHGIPAKLLADDGEAADAVLAALTEVARDYTVLSDSVLDRRWLQILAEACGEVPRFAIESIHPVYRRHLLSPGDLEEAQALALSRIPQRHRAAPDAERLAETLRILRGR